MKKLLASLVALVPVLASAGTSTWTVDLAHSSAGFAVQHLVISQVRGTFTKLDGTLVLDEADVTRSRVDATIDVNSIYTRDENRDGHLKSPDFFDAANHPKMTFKSTKVAKAGKNRLAVTGDLTIRGVTKPVTLDVTTTPEVKGMGGETRRGFTATTKIDRRAFGLAWNKMVEAGPVVGDEVAITLDLEVVKDQPKTAAR
ncbi:MAG TPA: YceI family protein [Anaeromyxobacteraceae bacterium]|nr:YceI family protein [Anaeromyxobacteraceae bacterium]